MKILNYIIKKVFAFLFLTLSCLFSEAQDNASDIPFPFVPIAELGKQRTVVEKAKTALTDGNLWDFYEIAWTFIRECEKIKLEEKRFEPKTREEAMALEWLYYFIVTAPMISTEEYLQKHASIANKGFGNDISNKAHLIGIIRTEKSDNPTLRNSLKRVYKNTYGIEYKEIFDENERRQTEIAHIAYYAALIKSFHSIYQNAQLAKKELSYAPTPGYVSPRPSPITASMSREQIIERQKKYQEDREKHADPARAVFRKKNARLSSIISILNPIRKDVRVPFVKKVIRCFPRDGIKVQEYLRKAGFSSNEECASLLEEVYPRTSETAYLFQGLPTEAEVAQYRKEKARSNAEKGRQAQERQKLPK